MEFVLLRTGFSSKPTDEVPLTGVWFLALEELSFSKTENLVLGIGRSFSLSSLSDGKVPLLLGLGGVYLLFAS